MEWGIAEARAAGKQRLLLGVKAANEAALAFYGRHGFERIGERKFLVGAMLCDDYVLARTLQREFRGSHLQSPWDVSTSSGSQLFSLGQPSLVE